MSRLPHEDRRRGGVVGVVEQAGLFLVIRRSALVIAPGRICFPGGGILDGESEPEALRRELYEELGLESAVPQRCLWRSTTPGGVALAWWKTFLDPEAPLRPNPAEVDEVFWSSVADLLAMPDLLASNREFFQALARTEITWEES